MTSTSSTRFAPNAENTTQRLSFPMIGAILVSFVALWLSESHLVLLPFLAFALVASRFVVVRFDAVSRGVKATRVVLFGLAAMLTIGRLKAQTGEVSPLFLLPCLGPIAACEIVILSWLREVRGGARGEICIFLSGVAMAAGGATFGAETLRFLVPLYFFLLLWSLSVLHSAPPGKNKHWTFSGSRIAVAIFAVGLGAGAHQGVRSHISELNEWGNRFFEDKPTPQPSGLSLSPQLGSSFGDGDAPSRVVTIRNLGDDPHLRAMSFDTYRDGRWFPLVGDRDFERVEINELKPNAKGRRAQVTRYLDDDGLLLAPLNTKGIVVAPDSELEWSSGDHTPLRSLDSLQNYELILPVFSANPETSSTRISAQEKARCLIIPNTIDARVRRIAAQMENEIQNPRARIEAVIQYLQAHHKYSLQTTRGEGDPLNSFLLENKAAHCEYFASSATILLRCMGVPTRYVIGYYGHENDGQSGDSSITTVRLRDAHAWAESWIDGKGWVTVEATPASGVPHKKATLGWNLKLRETLQDWLMSARHWLTHLVLNARLNQRAPLLFSFFVAIAAIGLWRRKSSTRCRFYGEPNAEMARLMKRFGVAMKRRGLKCPTPQTWREYLQTQPETTGILRFLDRYEAARFGGATTSDDLRELHRKLKAIANRS